MLTKPSLLCVYTSILGLGAVLAQVQEERVIVYASRSLHPTEQNDANYSSFKWELLGLKGPALLYILTTMACLSATEQHCLTQLASFAYDVKYRSKKAM